MAGDTKTKAGSGTGSGSSSSVDDVIKAGIGKLRRKNPVTTGGKRQFQLVRPNVRVVEMEDVLFHFDSCVLMPSAPEGKSSTQGVSDQTDAEKERADKQKKVTGLHALALTYKVLDEHNTLGILITGHTDTSGGTQGNFILSEERANNVLFLLEQRREDWANLSFKHHRVEDYQQILKHYAKKNPDWDCDPGKIDNSYGDKTNTASENFFGKNGLEPELANKAKFDGQHRWPVEAWLATYDLYDKEIDEILKKASGIPLEQHGPKKIQTCVLPEKTADKPKPRNSRLRFADIAHKVLGCGESFPIQKALKDNYKSQENRRVEILFLNPGEMPEIILPESSSQVLTKENVPLFAPFFFNHLYVDPFDIFAIIYHLRFVYYNRFTRKIEPVPKGLTIKAFDDKNKEIKSKTEIENGNYLVKVADDEGRKKIRFEFETTDLWIEMNSSGGNMAVKKAADVRALPLEKRMKFYDLPQKWSSVNYWTRHSGSMDNADRFDTVMELRLSLKPYGNKRTTPDQPLVFSLDDIVLVDENGRQTIFDHNQFDAKRSLSKNSRFSMFHIFDNKLALFDPDPNEPQFTLQPLEENLIHKTPVEARLIIFSNRFYDVWDKRAAQGSEPFNPSTDIRGCRAAHQNDPDCRFGETVKNTGASVGKPHPYFSPNSGNFDLHYIHTGCIVPGKTPLTRAFLMIYWSGRFKAGFDNKKKKKDPKKVTKAELEKFGREGCKNTKERWEMKDYFIEPQNPKDGQNFEIRPVFWLEPKKDTNVGGRHHNLFVINNNPDDAFTTIDGGQMYRTDFAPRADTDGGKTETDTLDSLQGKNLVVGHELGHAMGKPDEYMYRDKNEHFRQDLPGGPYVGEGLCIMNTDMVFPRMRHLWNFVNWLNDAAKESNKLKDKLDSQKFRIGYMFTFFGGEIFNVRYLKYFLDDEFRNIYKPVKSDTSFGLKTGSVEMDLFAWGEDETSRTPKIKDKRPPFAYGGRVAVYWKLGYKFINNPKKASDKWTKAKKKAFIFSVLAEVLALRQKTYLNLPKSDFRTGADAKLDTQFENLSIGFLAHSLEGEPTSRTNFDIHVVLRHDAKITKRSGKLLEVGNDVSPRWVAKYLLGIDDGATEAKTSATDPDIDATKVVFIRDWVRTEIGNNKFEYRDSYPPATTA